MPFRPDRERATSNKPRKETAVRSRREFLGQAGCLGALLYLGPCRLLPARVTSPGGRLTAPSAHRCRTLSIGRLAELKEWLDGLERAGRLSADPAWRRMIGSFRYAAPPGPFGARSIVVMALPLPIASIAFQVAGKAKRIYVPPGYADDGRDLDDARAMLYRSGQVPPGSRLERARLPLKLLAVRSGLAAYGRNNIAYVDGYGSYLQLLAFYSEAELEDHWGPLRMLRECKGCTACRDACPLEAIRTDDFIIDPRRCVSLYNERPDPIPAWIPPAAHHSLIGCLRCQLCCPANPDPGERTMDLGEVPEAETAALLAGRYDAGLERALKQRLSRIAGGDNLAFIARNLRLVLGAAGPEPRPRP